MVTREELEALQKDPLSKEKALEYQQKQEALARANELNNMSPVERGVSRFPFIIKNWKRKKLAYDGDVDYIADTVSPQHALQWYKENHKHIKDFKFNCFGDDEIFQLPVVAELDDISTLYPIKPTNIEKECKDITTEFIKVLGLLTSNRILKEKNFKIRQQLLQHYKLYEIEQPFPIFNIHFFVFDKPTSDQTLINAASALSPNSSSNMNLTPAEMEANNINKSNIAKQYGYVKEAQSFTHISRMTLQQIQELCAMKEFLEGKIKFKSFKLKGNVINNPYSNVTLNSLASLFNQPNNNEPNNNEQAPLLCGHYTSSIRYAMFGEEKYYKRIRPGQTLQPRQWIAKLHTGWVTSVVAPRRGGKCPVETEIIRLSNGTLTQAKNIKIGDELLSSDKTTPTKVVDVDRFQKQSVKVTLTDGTSFIVSKDHRIPTQSTYHDGKWDMDIDNYTTAENLQPGKDFVPTMFGIGQNEDTGLGVGGSYDEGLLIGLLLGDGSLTKSGTSITCTEECRRKIIYEVCDRLGYDYRLLPNNKDISISGLSDFRKEYGLYGGSYEKRIPQQVFGYSEEMKRGVINGLLYTDGYLSVEGSKKGKDGYVRNPRASIEFSSVSKELAEGLRILLCDLGIISSIHQKKKKTRFNHKEYFIEPYYIKISDKESLSKIISHCNFEGKRNVEQFITITDSNNTYTSGKLGLIPKCAFKEHTTQGVGHRTLYNGVREPHYDFQRWKCENYGLPQWLKYNWVRVEKVEDIGMQNVVHIECDGDHTYWIGHTLTHNTYRAIDEAVEMFTRDSQERSKPVRVLFVGINNKKLQTAIKYLLSFTKQFTEAGYFERESSKNIMHYRQSDSKGGKSKSIQDLGTIEFIGSKDDDAGVGDYADLIIIDECERIAENVWEDIMPIITNEGARCILISTLNKNSQKTWFYNQLIQGETEEIQRGLTNMDVVEVIKQQWNKRVQPHIDEAKKTGKPFEEWINDIDIDAMAAEMRYLRQWVGIRFTGEDNDLKTEQEKTFARDRLRGTKAYYPERWGIFPEDVGVYDYESSIKEKDYFNNRKYKYTVLAYDPAESRDKAALVYMGRDPNINKIEIFKTEKLPNNYTYHGPAIKKALADCKQYIDLSQSTTSSTNAEVDRYRQNTTTPVNPEMRTFFAYDYNGVGQGLEPFLQESGVRIDMKVRFTGQGGIVRKGNEHRVPKTLLVSNMQNMLDHNGTIINQECLELIEEMDHYKGYYNADTGYTKYQAEAGSSDDFVSATMIGSYFILEYMGEKYNISKNDIALDDYAPTIEDRYHDFERTIMEGLNSGKSVKDMMAEFNGEKQRHSLKRSDILSQFGY